MRRQLVGPLEDFGPRHASRGAGRPRGRSGLHLREPRVQAVSVVGDAGVQGAAAVPRPGDRPTDLVNQGWSCPLHGAAEHPPREFAADVDLHQEGHHGAGAAAAMRYPKLLCVHRHSLAQTGGRPLWVPLVRNGEVRSDALGEEAEVGVVPTELFQHQVDPEQHHVKVAPTHDPRRVHGADEGAALLHLRALRLSEVRLGRDSRNASLQGSVGKVA
mmetsp:Transcript_67860/g.196356  ORF Transcript_67860/g.196356 Transcript_67860/m.196356 type:complete len:216 (+) Transcript_67860:224-871(+)